MNDFLNVLLSDQFIPGGFCLLWRPELVWLHALADLVIALAYFAIPLTVVAVLFKQRKAIPFAWVFGMFAASMFFCGLTHVIEVLSIWHPMYYIGGLVKVIAAAISLATALIMFPLIPVLMSRFEEFEKMIRKNQDQDRS